MVLENILTDRQAKGVSATPIANEASNVLKISSSEEKTKPGDAKKEDSITDQAVNVFRELCRVPENKNGSISIRSITESSQIVTIRSTWIQRDVERMQKRFFTRNDVISVNGGHVDVMVRSPPQDCSEELFSVRAPKCSRTAVIRSENGNKKQFIEVWNDDCKFLNVNVESQAKHGVIYDEDFVFGVLRWSNCEDKFLYVAERKRQKACSWFDESSKSAHSVRGHQFVYEDDWGEMLRGKRRPVIGVFDTSSQTITVLDTEENLSCAQPIWCRDDSGIVFVGYNHEPYTRGIKCTPNRPSGIYHYDLRSNKTRKISDDGYSCQQPRCYGNECVIWLQCLEGNMLSQCLQIVKHDLKNGTSTIVLDIHDTNDDFTGLQSTLLPERCLMDNRLILATQCKLTCPVYAVDMLTGLVQRLTFDDYAWSVLDVQHNFVLATRSLPNESPHLLIGRFSSCDSSIHWTKINEGVKFDFTYEIHTHNVRQDALIPGFESLNEFESLVLMPSVKEPVSLVFWPHGGPHLWSSTSYTLQEMNLAVGLVLCGYGVLMVNYRGSFGYGDRFMRSLLGYVGDVDYADSMQCLKEHLDSGNFNRDRVYLWSGSYGGGLISRMIANNPGMFKAACTRNPTMNYLNCVHNSDINDWCSAVFLNKMDHDDKFLPSVEESQLLWERSPLRYVDKIDIPILFVIGARDVRVPPSQSLEFYRHLKARNVRTKLLMYDSSHPLPDVDSHSDRFVNMVEWMS